MSSFASQCERYYRRGDARSTGINFDGILDWDAVVAELDRRGTTSKSLNQADPFGDGDQRPFRNSLDAQLYREMWAVGANNHLVWESEGETGLHFLCFMGMQSGAEELLQEAAAVSKDKVREKLEARIGVNRLSALHFAFIGIGLRPSPIGFGGSHGADYIKLVSVLLRYGANPCAKDMCGKTVAHYAIGPLNKGSMLLEALQLCLEAAETLPTPVKLIDAQDRFGAVPIANAVQMNRLDLAKFCCDHKASVNIKDMDGISPRTLCVLPGTPMFRLIHPSSASQAVKAFKDYCGRCRKESESASLNKCGGCKSVVYCSKECQTLDWKAGHRQICKVLVGGADAQTLAKIEGFTFKYSADAEGEGEICALFGQGGTTKVDFWTGKLPAGFKLNTFFDVKCQEGGISSLSGVPGPIMIYDEERKFVMHVKEHMGPPQDLVGLYQVIKAFAQCDGRKCYLKACFPAPDVIFVAKGPVFARKW